MGEWYQDYFGPDYLLRYPEDTATTAIEVNQIVALLGLDPPARILDLGCGYGRHALALAKRGFQVVGLDLSTDQLGEARKRATNQGLAVEFVQGDMRRLPFQAEFDAVINVFTSFGYFEDLENRRVLEEVAKSLRPAGSLLMELVNRDGVLRCFQPTMWHELPAGFLLNETSFDPLSSRTTGRNIFISRSGEVREYHLSTRAYSLHELRTVLLESGFAQMQAYGGLDGSQFALDGLRTVLVAQRN